MHFYNKEKVEGAQLLVVARSQKNSTFCFCQISEAVHFEIQQNQI